MTNENVRFFQSFLRGFLEGLCWKVGFSYLLSYLIDKKEYRKGKIIGRKDCRFKKQLYFCAVKMANKNVRFLYHYHPTTYEYKIKYLLYMYACTLVKLITDRLSDRYYSLAHLRIPLKKERKTRYFCRIATYVLFFLSVNNYY